MILTPRPYQTAAAAAINAGLAQGETGLLAVLPTGCHASGTEILMHDGSVRLVENIKVGDLLMGPDSQPRQVLRLIQGNEAMHKITPKKGEPFVVNAHHILSLQTTNEGKKYACNTTGGEINNIQVCDWLTKAKSWQHLRKLRRTGVDFQPLPRPDLDPWSLGALLGDGSIIRGLLFTSPDLEILDALYAEMLRHGLDCAGWENSRKTAWEIRFSDKSANKVTQNRVTAILRELGVFGLSSGEKFVPDCYKIASKEDRLNILAGLLDTDGHLNRSDFDFISKSKRLAQDVRFIARSLGLAANLNQSEKYCQTGAGGIYWRVSISGDTDMIPMRCSRKKAGPRLQKKNPLVTGFTTESVGDGDFYGFTLDGDHLYLTADFMVHHNSGKTILLADLIHQWMVNWPETRVCVLAHTKELVEQNAAKFAAYWQQQQQAPAPMGIHCAGLGKRDASNVSVLFASIQSVTKKAMQLGAFDVLMIDEAHHIPTEKDEGVWRRFIADATQANPNVRIVGLSATPYRLGTGSIIGKETILKRVCYEVSVLELIQQGHLCPLITKGGAVQADTSTLHTRQGEYIAAEIESLMDQDNLIAGAVQEMISQGADRKSWIVFCAGINHADHVRLALCEAGIPAGLVTGKTPRQERDRTIADFKAGRLRALCNVNVLSEGFDHPGIDLVALLRPTKSAGLYYQQVGRSFRLCNGKQDALILDFAGVIAEHGPVDQIQVKRKEKGEGGEMPTKDCPECGETLHLSAMRCPVCGYEFPASPKHDAEAADAAILSSQIRPVRHTITDVRYLPHVGQSGVPTLRVDYYAGYSRVAQEWVCVEHSGYAKAKALQWLTLRYPRNFNHAPGTVSQLLDWIKGGMQLTKPVAIHLRPGSNNKKYPEIVRYEWPVADLLEAAA